MGKEQDEYIKYRLARAKETLEDAKSLATMKRWNSSINRLYYACFYAVLALLASYNINCRTHSGVKTQLSKHFVKPGMLEKKYGSLYADLLDLRQRGDYGDFFNPEEKLIVMLIPKVEEFISRIEALTVMKF